MAWSEPIIDRTLADVNFAKSKLAEWIRDTQSIPYDLKGSLISADLTRIEDDIKYLSETLDSLGYSMSLIEKTWVDSDVPTIADVTRILGNVSTMIANYCQQAGVPAVPTTMLSYTDINSIELNLMKLNKSLDAMISSFKKSGTIKSGGLRLLPQKRG